MTFHWPEYVKLAKELAGVDTDLPSQEAKLRSAISRAYYGVHCVARNYLNSYELNVPITATGTAHREVRDYFQQSHEAPRRQIGTDIGRLLDWRNKVDYRNTLNLNLGSTATAAITRASNIISKLEELETRRTSR